MPGLLCVRPGSVREVGDEAAGRGPERNDNRYPQCTDCVRTVHFLRDVAKPVTDADSHAKVRMRKKVRGLRTIEQAVLQRRASPGGELSAGEDAPAEAEAIPGEAVSPDDPASSTPGEDAVGGVVLDYCTAVRGILNDVQGGPLHPSGLQMAEA